MHHIRKFPCDWWFLLISHRYFFCIWIYIFISKPHLFFLTWHLLLNKEPQQPLLVAWSYIYMDLISNERAEPEQCKSSMNIFNAVISMFNHVSIFKIPAKMAQYKRLFSGYEKIQLCWQVNSFMGSVFSSTCDTENKKVP